MEDNPYTPPRRASLERSGKLCGRMAPLLQADPSASRVEPRFWDCQAQAEQRVPPILQVQQAGRAGHACMLRFRIEVLPRRRIGVTRPFLLRSRLKASLPSPSDFFGLARDILADGNRLPIFGHSKSVFELYLPSFSASSRAAFLRVNGTWLPSSAASIGLACSGRPVSA